MLQYLRSLIYVIQAYFALAVVGILWMPWALLSRRGARHGAKSWVRWCLWTAKWMVGLRAEIRGTPPTGEVLIAAKHQSFFDSMLIFLAVPRGRYIMKDSLRYMPILGIYAMSMGCVPVKRGQRAKAIEKMKADALADTEKGGQLMIYPQGTRVPPRASAPYKVGAGVLYEQLNQPVVPVACNVGMFWPRMGIMRNPGVAVIEFLDPIPPGQSPREITKQLETVIEEASNRLMDEADTANAARNGAEHG